MRVAVTGPSGLVGSALIERLRADGHDVVPMPHGPPTDQSAAWDPQSYWVREGVMDGVEAVVHLGGVSLGGASIPESVVGGARWREGRKRAIRSSRIDGTRTIVEAMRDQTVRPRLLISASAVGYYGDRGDEVLTETSPAGSGFLADLCEEWEAEARRAEEYDIRVVTLRSGVILSKRGGMLPVMLPPFYLGLGGRLGDGEQWFSWIALRDHIEAICRLLAGDLDGPVNLASPNPVTNREFTAVLGRVLGRPTRFPLPEFALKLMFGEMAEQMLLPSQRVHPERLQAAGFQFHQPDLEEALRVALGR